jgi:hypothetical protein
VLNRSKQSREQLENVSFYKTRWGRLCERPSLSPHQPVDSHAHRPFSFSRTAPLPRTRVFPGTPRSSPHSFSLSCPPLLHQHRLLSKVCQASGLPERWRRATPTQFFYGPQCKVELKGQGAWCFRLDRVPIILYVSLPPASRVIATALLRSCTNLL